jgi:hypothetical protein
MGMLSVRPMRRKELERPGKGLTFDVSEGGQTIGRILAGDGTMVIGDKSYTLRNTGEDPGIAEILGNLLKGRLPPKNSRPTLLTAADGTVVAAAQKTGPRAFAMSHGKDVFRFERAGFVSSTWLLYPQEGDTALGSVAKRGWFGASGTVDLPDNIDRTLQMFLFWLRYSWELEASASQGSTYTG